MAGIRPRRGLVGGVDVAGRRIALGWLIVTVFGAAASGCGVCTPQRAQTLKGTPPAAVRGAASAASGTSSGPAANLLLVVVFDQLGSDTLARHLPYLDGDGAIRAGISRGAYYPQGRYPQAVTLTGPGHALLATGAAPERSGITANEMRMSDGAFVPCVQGEARGGSVATSNPVSPALLAVPTVADALRAKYGDGSRVVSLSVKDRAAVLPAGQHPDVVLWFEPESGKFTTSAYYGEERPSWVEDFEEQQPLSASLAPWTVPDPDALLERLGPDAAPGEGDVLGFGTAFPHDPSRTEAPTRVLRLMPALSERLLSLAERAAAAEALGSHSHPDLLLLSISGTDYAGHVFGPDSWEYFDHLRRADRALGALIRSLSAHTSLVVFITSDHGVARLPELGSGLKRMQAQVVAEPVERALTASHGAGPWVEGFSGPYLYLTKKAIERPDRLQLRLRACEVLRRVPGIAHVVELGSDALPAEAGACAMNRLPVELREAVHRSLYPGRSGDFYVIPQQGILLSEEVATSGTNHGTPWVYDRTVPVIVYGTGVANVRWDMEVDMRQVAPSLAEMLGVPAPSAATSSPLPGLRAE